MLQALEMQLGRPAKRSAPIYLKTQFLNFELTAAVSAAAVATATATAAAGTAATSTMPAAHGTGATRHARCRRTAHTVGRRAAITVHIAARTISVIAEVRIVAWP